VPEWAEPVWHQYVVRHARRNELMQGLAERAIGSLVHYPIPPHRSGAYSGDGAWPALPIAEEMAATVLSLPMGPHLTPEQAREVVQVINGLDSQF
jgi:dTDP-4-amino-4,6-dideoxygalactose transaminase